MKDPAGNLTSDRLDWAFAGVSESTPLAETEPGRTHSVWRHWVDSRVREAETVVDEGDMRGISGGRTLETGKMVNPATGVETEYEEVWRGEEPVGDAVVVLRTEEEGRRGVVVRVGQYAQGILREGDEVVVQRREWTDGAGWGVTARLGDGGLDFAMGVATGEDGAREEVELGGKVAGGGFVWEVVELSGRRTV